MVDLYRKSGLSVRCGLARFDLSRSTYYSRPTISRHERVLRARIKALALKHPAFGYRSLTRILRREGDRIGFKRVRRIYRALNLQHPAPKPRKTRRSPPAESFVPTPALHSNHIWAIDIIEDRSEREGKIRILSIEDIHDRYAFPLALGRHMTCTIIADHLQQLLMEHGVPKLIRRDNGPEFESHVFQALLRRFRIYDEPVPKGQPFHNGHVEAFHSLLRRECLDQEAFETVSEAMRKIETWRHFYNEERPHSKIQDKTPAERRSAAPGEGTLPRGQSVIPLDSTLAKH